MTSPILEVKGLTAAYGDLRAIEEVSLLVPQQTVTAVLGRNGAGKTSALSAIAGLLQTTGGEVWLDGEDISHLRPSARIGRGLALVQENKRIFRRLTVEQNLQVGAYSGSRRRRRIADALTRAYDIFPILAAKANDLAGSLSGGQQQMLAIAQALMPDPKIIMLDEPSAGLAPKIVEEVLDEVRRLRDLGLAVLVVEQMVEQVLPFADRVLVLDLGRVVLDEPAAAVDAALVKSLYLGASSNVDPLSASKEN